MPAIPLDFRARCGAFLTVFVDFMLRRARKKASARYPTLKPRSRLDGVIVGLVLTVICFSNILMQCNDVELNPGPPKKQTRLSSSSGSGRVSLDRNTGSVEGNSQSKGLDVGAKEPTLTDVVKMLNDMKAEFDSLKGDMNTRFDELMTDMKEMKDSYSALQGDVQALSKEITDLKKENTSLREANGNLHERMNKLEAKTDDLESRSKRNNIIVHGIPRSAGETPEECESLIRDMITDKLELSGDFAFDRVHRINSKTDSPIIAHCTFYKQKVEILKAKRKLRGQDIFIAEDFSQRVRDIRKKLSPHLRDAKAAKKRATMIYDHLLIDGKKFVMGVDGNSIMEAT